MKLKPLTFLSMLLLGIQLSAQIYKLIAVDSKQNRDTVIFGNPFPIDATVGVDTQLGESNNYGHPYNTLEIRSIQRDSISHHCLVDQRWSHENLYFDENADMKIDYRHTFLDPWRVEPRNRNYEFIIHAENYPVYILGLSNGGTGDFYFTLLDTVCNVVQNYNLAKV
jgi:hypothetical protein